MRMRTLPWLFVLCYLLEPTPAMAFDCVRARPEPLVSSRSEDIASHAYAAADDGEAMEHVQMRSGARLQIRHWGCETYALTFTYIGVPPISERGRAMSRSEATVLALQHIRRLAPRDVPDLGAAAQRLLELAAAGRGLNDEVPVFIIGAGEGYFQTRVTLARASAEAPGAVVVTLSRGL